MNKIKENILSWCPNPEEGALKQAENISQHPWLIGNVCLMPDTHEGYGMPIGGVVALDKAVCPNMVGVDIGCQMSAVQTNLTEISTEKLKEILGILRNTIPVGMKHQKNPIKHPIFELDDWNDTIICKQEFQSAQHQLGTLGGGNHFIEIQKGSNGYIFFMVHSGSRNLGKKVADYYNKKAKEICAEWKHDEIIKNDLAILPFKTKEYSDYIKEMHLCIYFASANHTIMIEEIKKAFCKVLDNNVEFNETINTIHNYMALENHYGKNVFVHRKGAVRARKNDIVIIPGSQGTSSYICQGLGNEASLCSCSHGSGRTMSRKKAKETLNLQEEQRKLDEKGILHAIRGQNDLEEASSAYKDIEEVMKNQSDLVKPLVRLEPLAVIKG